MISINAQGQGFPCMNWVVPRHVNISQGFSLTFSVQFVKITANLNVHQIDFPNAVCLRDKLELVDLNVFI